MDSVDMSQTQEEEEINNTILIDSAKNPIRSLQQGWKALGRKFRSQYKFEPNHEQYYQGAIGSPAGIIFGAPRIKFSRSEIEFLNNYMEDGGSVLLMVSEGTEADTFQHVNRLTEQHGITVNHDCVVRTVYAKGYYHPKEAFIKDVSIMQAVDMASGKKVSNKSKYDDSDPFDEDRLKVVYPFGCTLNVKHPALPMLSSGPIAFPTNRALCAMSPVGNGRLIVCGSAHVFADDYLDKEDNLMLATALFKYVTAEAKTSKVDPERAEFQEAIEIPDMEALSERLRCCLQESEELPQNWTTLFDLSLFKYDVSLVPDAVELYKKLNVEHEALSVIPPTFEVPLPPLQPAVFFPMLRELPAPVLDLFDLDEKFASEKLKLAKLTNKCSDDDIEYFVREAGEVLGISDLLREGRDKENKSNNAHSGNKEWSPSGKDILSEILKMMINYRKFEQGDGPGEDGLDNTMQSNASNDSRGEW